MTSHTANQQTSLGSAVTSLDLDQQPARLSLQPQNNSGQKAEQVPERIGLDLNKRQNYRCFVFGTGGRYDGLMKAVWQQAAVTSFPPPAAVGLTLNADRLTLLASAPKAKAPPAIPYLSQASSCTAQQVTPASYLNRPYAILGDSMAPKVAGVLLQAVYLHLGMPHLHWDRCWAS